MACVIKSIKIFLWKEVSEKEGNTGKNAYVVLIIDCTGLGGFINWGLLRVPYPSSVWKYDSARRAVEFSLQDKSFSDE